MKKSDRAVRGTGQKFAGGVRVRGVFFFSSSSLDSQGGFLALSPTAKNAERSRVYLGLGRISRGEMGSFFRPEAICCDLEARVDRKRWRERESRWMCSNLARGMELTLAEIVFVRFNDLPLFHFPEGIWSDWSSREAKKKAENAPAPALIFWGNPREN